MYCMLKKSVIYLVKHKSWFIDYVTQGDSLKFWL